MPNIVLVSAAHDRMAGFVDALQNIDGIRIQRASTADAALTEARKTRPDLMVIDETVDRPALDLVREIMIANALIYTAVISNQHPDAFHDAAEGLGILMQLPDPPGPADADSLITHLRGVAAVPV